jgi:hypothetical protein
MANDRSLIRHEASDPARRSPRLPVPRGSSNAPIHQPRSIHWTGSATTREECWDRLSVRVRDRVADRLGELIEWWATESDGGIKAVALGTRALILVTPTLNQAGRPASKLVTVNLDENSFRSAQIREAMPPRGSGYAARSDTGREPATGERPGERPGDTAASQLTRRLDPNMAGFLGLLPTRAQQLLQDPFLYGDAELSFDTHAYRSGRSQGLASTTIRTWCYLTDKRALTFCAGLGRDYNDNSGATGWELTCWRADTTGRPATGAG